jgi:uncharacterized protein (TIGR03067 family)
MSHSDRRQERSGWNLRSLDGWWIADTAALGGIPLPKEALPGLSLLLCNRTLYLGDDVGTVDADHQADPPTIDVLIVKGPNRWRFIEGIYRRAGSTLTLCLDLSGTVRPTAFKARSGSRELLVSYGRAP